MSTQRCRVCGSNRAELCDGCAAETTYTPPAWTPFVPGIIPADVKHLIPFDRVWVNSRYQVYERRVETPKGPMVHLSIKRHEKQPCRDWRDFQRIKNELVGPQAEGVELFPAEDRVVDLANQYHLFVFTAFRFPFGFEAGRTVSDAETGDGSVQRPLDPETEGKLSAEEVKRRIEEMKP